MNTDSNHYSQNQSLPSTPSRMSSSTYISPPPTPSSVPPSPSRSRLDNEYIARLTPSRNSLTRSSYNSADMDSSFNVESSLNSSHDSLSSSAQYSDRFIPSRTRSNLTLNDTLMSSAPQPANNGYSTHNGNDYNQANTGTAAAAAAAAAGGRGSSTGEQE